MKLSEFDYFLPKSQIAQYPLSERDSSRLLVINRKHEKITHRLFSDITEYLIPGDVLVLNNTKVIPARLYGVNPNTSGGKVEILLLKELYTNTWEALVKGLHQGKVILKHGITAFVSRSNGVAKVKFDKTSMSQRNAKDNENLIPLNPPLIKGGKGGFSNQKLQGNLINHDIKNSLDKIGVTPLPPYIKRKTVQSDIERYQTVYAKKQGAVAAPTAGLHFTDNLLKVIRDKGVEVKMLTLHVGYGTFKPVLATDIKRHQMDEEFYEIPENTANAINRAKSEGRRVIAVGTTATRALEASAEYSRGNRIHPVRKKARVGLSNGVKAGTERASLFIYPGYRFRIIDVLITNFHLPKSTPMMLTSAFSGLPLLKDAYLEALNRDYRFFSYGDAMLII